MASWPLAMQKGKTPRGWLQVVVAALRKRPSGLLM
jgi:hypothetical protein